KRLAEVRALEREQQRIQRDEYSQLEECDDFQESRSWERQTKTPLKPTVQAVNPSAPKLAVGMKVQHKMFGTGKIIALQGSGDDAKAKVFFKAAGEKTLAIKFANLTVLD
ncbi:MAG: ATP-dependent DNA helicase PcrA, partial [Candidatus Thermochlorobacter sp.]